MRILDPKQCRLGGCRLSQDLLDEFVLLPFEEERRRRYGFPRLHRLQTQQFGDDLIVLRGVLRQFVEKGRYLLDSCADIVLGCQTDAGPKKARQRIERSVQEKLVTIRLDDCGFREFGLAAKLSDEARLADAGVADNDDRLAAPPIPRDPPALQDQLEAELSAHHPRRAEWDRSSGPGVRLNGCDHFRCRFGAKGP